MSDPFANLPPISFVNSDITALKNAIVANFQNAWLADTGEVLLLTQADRRYHFLVSLVAYLVQERELIDQSAKQNILPFSSGGFLDALATIYGNRSLRLSPSPATTTLQFNLSTILVTDAVIPAGTLIGSASRPNVSFGTDKDLIIPAGNIQGQVDARCTINGPDGNGLLVGDLINLITWTGTFAVTVTNIIATAGGGAVEEDADYRLRIYDVTDSYSNAGSYGAYKFFAESADIAIAQVGVSGPEDGFPPGNVQIVVLLENGQLPNQAMLDKVAAAINPDNVRDLCAKVTVLAPSQVAYSITLEYAIDTGDANNAVQIKANVVAAVNQFVHTNSNRLGGSINPAVLSEMVMDSGASYCKVISPVYQSLSKSELATLVNDPQIIYLGLQTDK